MIGDSAGYSLNTIPFIQQTMDNGNIFIGVKAASFYSSAWSNVVIGHGAAANNANTLYSSVIIGIGAGKYTAGGSNTLVGGFAGSHSNGEQNTLIGAYAGAENRSGRENVFVGANAGTFSSHYYYGPSSNSVMIGNQAGFEYYGSRSVFVGHQAGQGISQYSVGTDNVAVGYRSGRVLTSGYQNTYLGNQSGEQVSTGSQNVFIGYQSGQGNISGTGNTLIGNQAGLTIVSGSDNTLLGRSARSTGSNAAMLQNATAIGANALVGVSNGFVLGDTTNTNVGIGTAYPNQRLTIRGNMNFLTASNLRFDNSPFLDINQNRLALGGEKGEFPVEIISSLRYKVAAENQWADYVFAPDFRKLSLKDVAAFIQQNGHLPGIPSAKEVIQNGVDAAQMDAKLLAQIEQLTLHAIEQKTENEQLKAENNQLKKSQHMMQIQLDTLLKRIEKLETNR